MTFRRLVRHRDISLLIVGTCLLAYILGCAPAGTGGGVGSATDEAASAIAPPDGRSYGNEAVNVRLDAAAPTRSASQTQSATQIQPGEELWVIVEPENRSGQNEDIPGCGALMAQLANEPERVPIPLKHTDVQGRIQSYVASVEVTQQFQNPYDSKIEAVYVFPLPQNAAVNDFIMTVGERKIRGIIREREQAEQIYKAARSQGYVASLLTQERPNIFTQKVANIEPGHQIDINIQYFHTLQYDDGHYEFTFPMVVGPRFNPPCSTDGIGAVARGKTGTSGQMRG